MRRIYEASGKSLRGSTKPGQLQRYQATLAETQAKLMQPELVQAQLAKAKNDAAASAYQTRVASAQADKTEQEAAASKFMPDTSKYQMQRAGFDALAATFQPQTAQTQLTKLQLDAKKAGFELPAAAAQAIQAEQNSAISNSMMKILAPFYNSLAGEDAGKVNAIIDPSKRLNELQGSMNAGQTHQGAGTTEAVGDGAAQGTGVSNTAAPKGKARHRDTRKVGTNGATTTPISQHDQDLQNDFNSVH